MRLYSRSLPLLAWIVGLTAERHLLSAAGGEQQPPGCPVPVTVDVERESTFVWKADPGLEEVARALARRPGPRRPFPGIGAYPGDGTREILTVWLVQDLDCLPPAGDGAPRPDWVAGLASAPGGFLALRADRGRGDLRALPAVFRHEIAHLALDRATGGNAPRWLQEGYAQYAAAAWNWQQAWRLRFLLLRTEGSVLRELSLRFPRDPEPSRLAYLLSYTAVHELASIGGDPGLAALFAELGRGSSVDGALRRVFGLTAAQFEARWRRRVGKRYGVLYVLSRASLFWVAVTLLLLWVGSRRRRRNRERLQALREAESREEAEGGWPDAR
ncbi:MAG: peptidase MA family metallohydrolase [Gemmatimonadota bacterium]